MDKKSSDLNLELFVSTLNDSKSEVTAKKSEQESAFARNITEMPSRRNKSATRIQYFDDLSTKSLSLLRAAIDIFAHNFFTFFLVNFVISSVFLFALFGLLYFLKSSVPDIHSVLQNPKRDGALFASAILLFWIFFSWLRASYLTISSNYFTDTRRHLLLIFGVKKLFSFLVLEIMQIVIITIGALFVFLAPFYGARYFLASPIMIEEDEDAIGSMLLSAKHVGYWMLLTIRCMTFSWFVAIGIILILYSSLSTLVSDQLILLSLIFFIFSFFVLPIHSCFRFALHKKLQSLTGGYQIEMIATGKKLVFALSHIILLAVLLFVIWLFVVGMISSKSFLSIDSLMSRSGLVSFFENIFYHADQFPVNTSN